MTFEPLDGLPGAEPDLAASFRAEWEFLAAPGTWLTGDERVAVAAVARAARSGDPIPKTALDAVEDDVAITLGRTPGVIRADVVDAWYRRGLVVERYIEMVGIASRITAVDSFHRAMGLPLEALPQPMDGEPTRIAADPSARRTRRSYAPTVGAPQIVTVLSLVPAEQAAWIRLSDAMYMTFEAMNLPGDQRGLHRSEIEVVAARTSLINECFF
ncbi:hypothetical protein HQ535_03255 [bacterium]|nr:hypothetical protein [bacterium]